MIYLRLHHGEVWRVVPDARGVLLTCSPMSGLGPRQIRDEAVEYSSERSDQKIGYDGEEYQPPSHVRRTSPQLLDGGIRSHLLSKQPAYEQDGAYAKQPWQPGAEYVH